MLLSCKPEFYCQASQSDNRVLLSHNLLDLHDKIFSVTIIVENTFSMTLKKPRNQIFDGQKIIIQNSKRSRGLTEPILSSNSIFGKADPDVLKINTSLNNTGGKSDTNALGLNYYSDLDTNSSPGDAGDMSWSIFDDALGKLPKMHRQGTRTLALPTLVRCPAFSNVF
jgi:hypothetical protein